jgi:hypothetical protein
MPIGVSEAIAICSLRSSAYSRMFIALQAKTMKGNEKGIKTQVGPKGGFTFCEARVS